MKLSDLTLGTLTESQIRQTDEYKFYKDKASDGDIIAGCLLVLRGDCADPGEAITRAQLQMRVAHTAQRDMVERKATMTWRPSGPVGQAETNNDFIKLILGKGNVDLRSGRTVMNCWEAVITAAMLDGALTDPGKLAAIYHDGEANFTRNLVHTLSDSGKHAYAPQTLSGRPIMGDVVFFDNLSHVALANGKTVAGVAIGSFVPGTQVISFWPAPAVAQFGPGTKADVDVVTIEALDNFCQQAGLGQLNVTFGSPNWKNLN